MNEECVPGDSRHGSLATFSELVWFFGFGFFFGFLVFPRLFGSEAKSLGKTKKNKKTIWFFWFSQGSLALGALGLSDARFASAKGALSVKRWFRRGETSDSQYR